MQKTVTLRFNIYNQQGTLVASSGKNPVRYKLGSGSLPAAAERAAGQLIPGQRVKVPLTAAQAFGEYDPERSMRVAHSAIKGIARPGRNICIDTDEGAQYRGVITRVDDKGVVVDTNHPLVGQDLVFDITVVGIDSHLMGGFSLN